MRFYVSPEGIFPERSIIEIKDKKEIHHIRNVMRLKKGISINVFDGKGMEYSGDIKDVKRDSITIEIKESRPSKAELPYRVSLFQAIPKKGKMDFIVEKAVELGVERIVPMITERTIWNLDRHRSAEKVERWRRISRAASNQCGGTKLPFVSEVTDFKVSIKEAEASDLVIFAALDRAAVSLKSLLKEALPKKIAVFVGPEGDFSEREIVIAKEKYRAISSLGALVLRVETAGMYILSCLNYQYGIQG